MKELVGRPSEIWKIYGGKVNEHIRRLDELLGAVTIVERILPPFTFGRAKEDCIEINRLLPRAFKRRTAAHELGHKVGKKYAKNEAEEEYIARVIEHLLVKCRLPSEKDHLGISSTLVPKIRKTELLRVIKDLFNVDL